jgi:uncharacterized alkaline shock family protein YloU
VNRWTRFILIIFSFILAVVFLLSLSMIASNRILEGVVTLIVDIVQRQPARTIALITGIVGLLITVITLVLAILSGRLRRTRVRENEIGQIEIGVEAIESIALNAAKASQSGVKSSRARVSPYKDGKLSILLMIQVYPNVEIPIMMARVQDRVKKDIEKYTGIEVGQVRVRVHRVEAISPRVER